MGRSAPELQSGSNWSQGLQEMFGVRRIGVARDHGDHLVEPKAVQEEAAEDPDAAGALMRMDQPRQRAVGERAGHVAVGHSHL